MDTTGSKYKTVIIGGILILFLAVSGLAAQKTYTVKKGDCASVIAQKCHVSLKSLLQANRLTTKSRLRLGQKLVIPGKTSAVKSSGGTYVVKKGDCPWLIARRCHVPLKSLLHANNLTTKSRLRLGQKLVIPGKSVQTASKSSKPKASGGTYVVKKGDCPWLIARRCHVPLKSLLQANKLTTKSRLRPGQKLTVPGWKPRTQVAKKSSASRKVAKAKPSSSGGSKSLVTTAFKYRGVRYRYGGMSSRGMDCSGFVSRVLRDHGIRAPHNSKALYRLGKPVSRKNLQPGDLVFFHTTRPGISHVGMYIGNGKFIHASSHRGRKVRVDSLGSGYYSRRYVGARRVK